MLLDADFSRTVDLDRFEIGQSIEVRFHSPDTGRVTVYLVTENADVPIVIDLRYKWVDGTTDTAILNTQYDGTWGYEERIPFSPTDEVKVEIHATETGFDIYLPYSLIEYSARNGLDASTVKGVRVDFEDTDGEGLKSIEITYM